MRQWPTFKNRFCRRDFPSSPSRQRRFLTAQCCRVPSSRSYTTRVFSFLGTVKTSWFSTGLGLHSFAQHRSYLRATVSDLLSSLIKKERPWTSCPRRSLKRVTVSNSLPSLLTKKRLRANRSRRSLKKSDMSAWFARDSSESLWKTSDSFEKIHIFHMFLTVFHFYSPFLCLRANRSRRSSLSSYF